MHSETTSDQSRSSQINARKAFMPEFHMFSLNNFMTHRKMILFRKSSFKNVAGTVFHISFSADN